ncbi:MULTISPECIES: O-antigen ligase family protein [unclassified Mycolicibacterium]|uniref:O-antigen ligase family protein n=1 Tax=unclassified Mycolicibacterium TaxID=2636767 RepID=UPI001F4C1F3C|nr:O-antigen ligase family protein [Mycolicibacterium sp. YH-1]UNB51889.1 O-antigen ligase family protein [Mycolicibacterium sp. YH-1]
MNPGTLTAVKPGRLLAVFVIGCGLVALGISLVGPLATAIAVAGVCGVWAAWHVVRRPAATAMTMIVIEVTNLSGVAASHSSVPIFHASLAMGVVAVVIALCQAPLRDRLNRGTAVCIGLVGVYLFTESLAVLSSQDMSASISVVIGTATDCAFLIVILLLTQMSQSWWAIAGSVAIPLAVLSALTVLNQVVFGGAQSFGGFAAVTEASGELVTTLRFGGPLPDSNFWGRHLVLGLPFAAALLGRAVRSARRWPILGWCTVVILLFAGIYLTQSRGTIIAAGITLAIWVIASGPSARKRGFKSLPLLILVLLIPGVGNRLVALVADVTSAETAYVIDPSVLGRMAAQEIAWAMFEDRPWFGFGPGAYLREVPHYAGMVKTAVLETTDGAHNLYAQIAAETGIVGLVGWVVMVLGFVWCIGLRTLRIPPERFPAERTMAAAALAAIVGWSIASVFLHLAYFRTFGICLAFAGALGSSALPGLRTRIPVERAQVQRVTVAVLLGTAATAGILALAPERAHTTASQRITLVPTAMMSDYYAYTLDIRSRTVVLPSYAAMIVGGQPAVAAVADTVRGVIDISVTDPDPAAAAAALDAAVIQGRANLADLEADSWYSMTPVGEANEVTDRGVAPVWIAGALIVGVATAAATGLMLRLRHRQTSGEHRLKRQRV